MCVGDSERGGHKIRGGEETGEGAKIPTHTHIHIHTCTTEEHKTPKKNGLARAYADISPSSSYF